MPNNWDDKLFQKWLDLREEFRTQKKNKDWIPVIKVCNEIIDLDLKAKFIGIMIPIFHREIARAYQYLNNFSEAIKFYSLSKEGFLKHRKEKALNKPDDWLIDISKIDKKISTLKNKIENPKL